MLVTSITPITSEQSIEEALKVLRAEYGAAFQHEPKSDRKLRNIICKLGGYSGGYAEYKDLHLDGNIDADIKKAYEESKTWFEDAVVIVFSRHKAVLNAFIDGVEYVEHGDIHVLSKTYIHPKLGYVAAVVDRENSGDFINLDERVGDQIRRTDNNEVVAWEDVTKFHQDEMFKRETEMKRVSGESQGCQTAEY